MDTAPADLWTGGENWWPVGLVVVGEARSGVQLGRPVLAGVDGARLEVGVLKLARTGRRRRSWTRPSAIVATAAAVTSPSATTAAVSVSKST